RIVPAATAVCLLGAHASADDGVLIVQKVTSGAGAAMTHQIQITPHPMRMEFAGATPRGSQVIVFHGSRQVMMMIDDANKHYSEITKADLDALSGMMAQMQDMLKNMPPEQRAQMEAMMKGRGAGGRAGAPGGAAPSKTQYTRVGTDTVGKWKCDKYEGTKDGQKTSELCTVDPKALGFSMADFGVTKDMAAFFEKLMPADAAQMFRLGTPEEAGFSGVPVRTVNYIGGQTVTQELTDIKRQAFADTLFQAPAGYQKQDSPLTRGRGRRH